MYLVTGFEPFGGLSRNPSGEVAQALAGPNVAASVLPVDWDRIGPALDDLLAQEWEGVVLTGVAIGRSVISLERVAINHRDGRRADNRGAAPPDPSVVAGGPDAYFSTLPLDTLLNRMRAASLPVEISLSAGAYLCNASFYYARHVLAGRGVRAGFVHLPPTPDLALEGQPLEFDRQVDAIGLVLDELGVTASA